MALADAPVARRNSGSGSGGARAESLWRRTLRVGAIVSSCAINLMLVYVHGATHLGRFLIPYPSTCTCCPVPSRYIFEYVASVGFAGR